jgi:phenylpropionate dioxygenase-like ring-hydroxylating dioxygenase large terminal subunit
LIDEFCAHRGVSLWFGRNEENGLRCPYHGWKYDVTGQCVEVPSEPVESGYCKRIRLKSYPLVERGGILWTYMGAPDRQPPLPEFEVALVRPEQRYVAKRLQESNWLQGPRGRHRLQPCVLAASREPEFRSAVQGRARQPVQSQ